MDFLKRNAKRVAVDAAGYLLLVAALATGWLPGPGGIPLAIAGLGLLSMHNEWARKLREYLLKNGSKLVTFLFPQNSFVQWFYDFLVFALFIVSAGLLWRHAAIWQISLGIAAFFFAGFIALMNRERLHNLQHRKK